MPTGVYKRTERIRAAIRKHGMIKTPVYRSWEAMKQRCNNPRNHDYPHYGGRGIVVCERWSSFVHFLADMGVKPAGLTLDRIDNEGNYEPGNCRWATRKVQSRNQRDPGGWAARRRKAAA